MAVKGDDVTVQNSGATVIWTATQAASIDHPNRIWVENRDGSIVITVGGSDVADASNGMKLVAGARIGPITLSQPQEKLYAIAASGTPTACILVTGV
jgi:uncharacterized protein (DUF427 family)